MTVKPNESRERSVSDQKPEPLKSPEIFAGKKAPERGVDRSSSTLKSGKLCAAESSETDQESGGSSEETESPRSVEQWRMRRKKSGFVHSQILRIREEDSHLGEDIKDGSLCVIAANGAVSPPLHVVILPCSPLGGKTAVNAFN